MNPPDPIRPLGPPPASPAARLPANSDYLRTIINIAPVILFSLDENAVFTLSEGKGLRALGLEAGQVVGQSALELYKDYPKIIEAVRKSLAGQAVREILEVDDSVFEVQFDPVVKKGRVVSVTGVAIDITFRHRAAQELAENRRMLLTLTSNLPGMVYRCANDPDWTVLFVSEGCRELTGFEPQDLVNNSRTSYAQLIHPDDRRSVWDGVQEAVAANRPFQLTYRIRTADNQVKWVWEQGRGIRTPGGELQALEGFITDITARKNAEERVNLLALAVEQISEGIAIADLDGRLLFVNRALELTHGYRPEELVGKHLSLLHSPEQMPEVNAALEQVRGQGHFQGEIGHRHRDGHTVPIFMYVSLLRDEHGKPIAMIATMRDMTEQKKAEEALRRERNFNLTLVQASPTFFVAINDQGRTLMMNAAMLRALGYTAEEVVGTDYLSTFVPPEEHAGLREIFSRLVETAEPTTNENHIITRDGRRILVEWHGQQVFKPDGRFDFFFGVGIDITERKKTEEERARLEAQLYQIQKLEAIGQFAGGVAHDFNNLLAVIMGNASILRRDRALDDKHREALADIMTAAERGSALTHQLLAYARGGLQEPTATDVNRLIRALLPILERTAPAGIRFDLQLADDLPTIVADPPRIEQIIMNLCLNAVQATTPPGVVTISTSAVTLDPAAAADLRLKEGHYLRLEVTDRGCGIPAEIRDRIFEPFFTTKEMARGLGLSVTHGVIHSHGGQVRVRSAPNEGTAVTLWLPASNQPEAAVKPGPSTPRMPQLPRGSETILVIDDEPSLAVTLEQLLSTLGYCVLSHTDSEKALTFLETNAEDVHLILCDLTMPRLTGRDVANLVAERYPHIAVLIVSGYDADTLAQELKGVPAAGFILKPFALADLARTVREALDHHAPRT